MRNLIVGAFVSLDGVMQAPGGPEEDPTGGFDLWRLDVSPIGTRPMGEAMGESFARPFDLLLGRKTYEIFAAYWPYHRTARIADPFNAVTKYVATSSAEPLAWHNSVGLEGDVPAAVARLKEEDGPDLLDPGQHRARPVAARRRPGRRDPPARLPGPARQGQAAVRRGYEAGRVKLLDTRTSTTGVVISRYRPRRRGAYRILRACRAERGRDRAARKDEAEEAHETTETVAGRISRHIAASPSACSTPGSTWTSVGRWLFATEGGVMERVEIDACLGGRSRSSSGAAPTLPNISATMSRSTGRAGWPSISGPASRTSRPA